MTIQLKHGVILTAFRQEIVERYETRHAWVGWFTVSYSDEEWEQMRWLAREPRSIDKLSKVQRLVCVNAWKHTCNAYQQRHERWVECNNLTMSDPQWKKYCTWVASFTMVTSHNGAASRFARSKRHLRESRRGALRYQGATTGRWSSSTTQYAACPGTLSRY